MGYVAKKCGGTSDTVCKSCTTCSNGQFASSPCSSDGIFDTVCTRCTTCSDGHFYERQCSVSADSKCTRCSECPDGSFVTAECTVNSDTKCGLCSDKNCKTCASAAAGQCLACKTGFFLLDGNCFS